MLGALIWVSDWNFSITLQYTSVADLVSWNRFVLCCYFSQKFVIAMIHARANGDMCVNLVCICLYFYVV